MGDDPRKKLLALAKQQLGLPASSKDAAVPYIYVKELQHHLSMCPLDDNFRVTLQPKCGYGTVACLEQGCDGLSIALGARLNAQDGGVRDGLGSLAEYRAHIEDHPLHRKSRLARVKGQNSTRNENNDKASTHRGLVKQEGSGLLRLLDTPPITSSASSPAYIHNNTRLPVTTSNSASVARRVSSLVCVKPEPVDSALPQRKRTSDSAFSPLAKAEDNDDPFNSPAFSSKRLKMDASHKTPHAQVNYNALVPSESEPTTASAASALTSPPSMSMALVTRRTPHPEPCTVEDIRAKIEDTQARISYLQEHINRIFHKPKMIKANLTRLGKLLSEMEECKRRKSEYAASIPNLSPVKRRPTNTSLSVIPPPNFGGGPTVAGTSSFAPPPAFQNPAYPLVRFRGASSPLEVARRRAEARQLQAQPIASGSNVRLPSATPSSAPSSVKKEEQLPLSPFAMRMGIRGRLSIPDSPKPLVKPEPAPIPFLVEKVAPPPRPNYVMPGAFGGPLDGYDSDEGGMAVDPAVYADVVNRIGINVPLPLEGAARFDRDGDFYGRGKDMFLGPQAKADDIDKFLIEAGNAEAFDGNASVDKALERLQLRTQYDLIPGMEVALMPHQTIGVAWMVDKEASTLQGGCLGDDMGLGKTVQMIAVIVKKKSLDPQCKTNLIIAPTALLDQWKIEIEMKTNCGLKCLIYHGTSKPKRKQDLLNYDVVLTTYMTMSLEWPDIEGEMKKKEKARKKKKKDDFMASDDDGEFNNKEARSKKRQKDAGLLFQVDFFRVILDEAQAIRNRRTRTSRAVTDLRAVYRWCLTGTPIINSLGDVYGYLRFLKIRPWYDFAEFQRQVGRLEKKKPALAVSRLQAIIQTFLLRRMKDSMLDGKHLIELPEKKVELIRLEFTQEERDIYAMVEARNQATFNRFLRAGTVLKNYHQVLVLLLRLRQLCSHPSLIQEDGVAFISSEEVHENDSKSPEIATELSRARRLVSLEFVTRMKGKFKASVLARIQAEKESVDAAADDEECPICFDPFTSAVITPCAHVFCRDCLVEVIRNAAPVEPNADDPTKYKANERPCPSCRDPICEEKLFEREAFEPSDEDLLPPGQKPKDEDTEMLNFDAHEVIDVDAIDSSNDRKGKGKAKSRTRRPKRVPRSRRIMDSDDVILLDADTASENEEEGEEDDMSDFIVDSDEDEEEKDEHRALKKKRLGKRRAHVVLDSDEEIEDTPEEKEVLFGQRKVPIASKAIKLMPHFLPSTKMKYMMERILQLAKDRPDEKILVVSQWTACLSLVSDYLLQAGIIHVKYQGDMNRTKRNQAVRVFMSKDKARIMLMSLKCGGVGLNLTRANNVISLDLGWSQAIESQAFDRVHRLGQTRSVDVQRLVISDTVEDRVLAMQLRKQTLADGSLGEGTGKKIGRLTVRELANLFGLDHRGRLLTKD